jgi:transcriptional regulator with XRE-family HTH domain
VGQAMPGSTGPLIPRRRLGATFRRLREEKGEQLKDTAKTLMFSTSKLSRIETGVLEPQPRDLRDLLAYFQLTDTRLGRELQEWAVDVAAEPWWALAGFVTPARVEAYLSYESAASVVSEYAPSFLPGLLQTEDYSRAVLSGVVPRLSPAEIDHQARLRHLRRRFLDSRPESPRLVMAFPEDVLHRMAPGQESTHRAQLSALLGDLDDPRIDVHVLSYRAGFYPALDGGPFTIFEYPDDEDPTTVALMNVTETTFSDDANDVADCQFRFSDLRERSLNHHDAHRLIESVRNSIVSEE